jgi:hypothetical protein
MTHEINHYQRNWSRPLHADAMKERGLAPRDSRRNARGVGDAVVGDLSAVHGVLDPAGWASRIGVR